MANYTDNKLYVIGIEAQTLDTAVNFRSRGQRSSLDSHRVITSTVRHNCLAKLYLYQNPISIFQLLRGDTRTVPKTILCFAASVKELCSAALNGDVYADLQAMTVRKFSASVQRS